MKNLNNILHRFSKISLAEMDRVALMERMDSKFIFEANLLEQYLPQLTENYSILDIDGKEIFAYESLYYDTPNFDLYKFHHRGKLNRYKFRIRKYVESNLMFFEVKFKNNRGRTKKSRFVNTSNEFALNAETNDFLKQHSNFENSKLEEKIWVNYHRITLVNKFITERVTLDLNLTFINGEKKISLNNIVVAEVKQSKSSTSPFIALMHQHHIREGAISKYCLGICHLYEHVISNNFKPFLLRIKKFKENQFSYVTP